MPGPEGSLGAHQQRRRAFGVALLAGLEIQHELRQRTMQAGYPSAQEGESRAGHLRAGFEIQPQRGADIGMLLRIEIESGLLAPGRNLDIAAFVFTGRHVGGRNVGQGGQQRVEFLADAPFLFLQRGHGGLEFRHLGLERFGGLGVALAHRLADGLRRLVTARLRLLHARGQRAAFLVQFEDACRSGFRSAQRQAAVETIGLVTDNSQIVHGQRLCLRAKALVQ